MIPEIDMHKHFKDKNKTRKIIDLFLHDMYEQGYTTVRIIHGKGKGDYRKLIYAFLEKHELVDGFTLCDATHGGSGATFVHLRAKSITRKT